MIDLLEDKKKIIYNLTKLGMDIDKAHLIAECSEEEIALLDKDVDFNKKLEVYLAIAEKRLLKMHAKACRISAEKGSATGIQWKLSKINPDKWGDKKVELTIPGKLVIEQDDAELL